MTNFRDRVNHFVAPLAAAATMTACGEGPKEPLAGGIPFSRDLIADCKAVTDPLSLKRQAVMTCEHNAFSVKQLATYIKTFESLPNYPKIEAVLFKTVSKPAVPSMITTPFAPQARAGKQEMLPPEVPGVTMDPAKIKDFAEALKTAGLEGTNVMLAQFNDKTVASVSAEFGTRLGAKGIKSYINGTAIIGYKPETGEPAIVLPVSALSKSPEALVEGVKAMLKKINGQAITLGRA